MRYSIEVMGSELRFATYEEAIIFLTSAGLQHLIPLIKEIPCPGCVE